MPSFFRRKREASGSTPPSASVDGSPGLGNGNGHSYLAATSSTSNSNSKKQSHNRLLHPDLSKSLPLPSSSQHSRTAASSAPPGSRQQPHPQRDRDNEDIDLHSPLPPLPLSSSKPAMYLKQADDPGPAPGPDELGRVHSRVPENNSNGRPLRRMSTGSIPSIDRLATGSTVPSGFAPAMLAPSSSEELQVGQWCSLAQGWMEVCAECATQLCYGHWPVETQRELSLGQIEEVVRLCGHEIKARGLESPMLFSSLALDVSSDNICSLIRSYVSNKDVWRRDIRFANPHDLCGVIKWALGRYVNPQGLRGFLSWDTFERWRFGEREKDFPPRYITTNMIYLLPTQVSSLLSTLLSLLSRAVAYTTKNGCTTWKLGALFGPFIFGLPDDATFEHTYTAFNRFAHATEHLLLAYIRDQTTQLIGSGAPAPIPIRLRELVAAYPQCLPINLNKPPIGAQTQSLVRIRRLVRFYSKNLVASAGTWNVPRSAAWASISPFPSDSPDTSAESQQPPAFLYTSRYRHLLNIRNMDDEEIEDDDLQKYRSVTEKQWSSFMQSGFAPPDASKLKFDLTEGERAKRLQRRESLDWDTFTGKGFVNLEAMDLAFDPLIDHSVIDKDGVLSSMHRTEMAEKARQIEKALPPFNYDITPREERSVKVDKHFLEVFSDVLCASGWARDEVKESHWALLQFRTRPLGGDGPIPTINDGRTEDTWFLVEEIIPAEYRASLIQAGQKPKSSRRISFLRAVRRKNAKLPPIPVVSGPIGVSSNDASRSKISVVTNASQNRSGDLTIARGPSPSLRVPDESVFMPGKGGTTKQMTLYGSNPQLTHDENALETLEDGRTMAPRSGRTGPQGSSSSSEDLNHGIGGTLASQKAYHRNISGGGIGFTKPSGGGAGNALVNLARRVTRRNRNSISSIEGVSKPGFLTSTPPKNQQQFASQAARASNSPDSPYTPETPNFDRAEHGVSGPGMAMAPFERQQQDCESNENLLARDLVYRSRVPSTITMETRGTTGHSDANTITGGSPVAEQSSFAHGGRDRNIQQGRSVSGHSAYSAGGAAGSPGGYSGAGRGSVISGSPVTYSPVRRTDPADTSTADAGAAHQYDSPGRASDVSEDPYGGIADPDESSTQQHHGDPFLTSDGASVNARPDAQYSARAPAGHPSQQDLYPADIRSSAAYAGMETPIRPQIHQQQVKDGRTVSGMQVPTITATPPGATQSVPVQLQSIPNIAAVAGQQQQYTGTGEATNVPSLPRRQSSLTDAVTNEFGRSPAPTVPDKANSAAAAGSSDPKGGSGHRRRDSLQAKLSAQIEARKAALAQPSAPQSESGRVAALASRFTSS